MSERRTWILVGRSSSSRAGGAGRDRRGMGGEVTHADRRGPRSPDRGYRAARRRDSGVRVLWLIGFQRGVTVGSRSQLGLPA
jgi:hypothetical protein